MVIHRKKNWASQKSRESKGKNQEAGSTELIQHCSEAGDGHQDLAHVRALLFAGVQMVCRLSVSLRMITLPLFFFYIYQEIF